MCKIFTLGRKEPPFVDFIHIYNTISNSNHQTLSQIWVKKIDDFAKKLWWLDYYNQVKREIELNPDKIVKSLIINDKIVDLRDAKFSSSISWWNITRHFLALYDGRSPTNISKNDISLFINLFEIRHLVFKKARRVLVDNWFNNIDDLLNARNDDNNFDWDFLVFENFLNLVNITLNTSFKNIKSVKQEILLELVKKLYLK